MVETLNAGEICNRIVVVIEGSAPLLTAARRMREQHVGCLVVVDESGAHRRVAGILTDRDIVTAVIAEGVDPSRLRVEDAMSTEVVSARESDALAALLATMRRKGLRRLPVLGEHGTLTGLVTLDDLLSIIAEQLRAVVQAIDSEQRRERRVRR